MKVSVVMSVYNGAEHLAATMDSILAQTEGDFELIVVDDGSTDESPRLLASYATRDARVRVLSQANTGLTRALAAGCAAATAPLIARHDAGDLSHPRRLEKEAALFERFPEVVLASCAVDFVGPEGELLHNASGTSPAERPVTMLDFTKEHAVVDGPSHHGAAMFRREAYERAGGYRAQFYFGQDWDLWYRLAELGQFARVAETLYTARVTPGSISASAKGEQELLATLSREALFARHRGESDQPLLARAAAIRPSSRRGSAGAGLYFIGEALRRNGDPRARRYLRRAIAENPLLVRAWIRLAQSWMRS